MTSSRTQEMIDALVDAQIAYQSIVENFDKFSKSVLHVSTEGGFLKGLTCDLSAYRPFELEEGAPWPVTAFRLTFMGRAYTVALSTKVNSVSDCLVGVAFVKGLIGSGRQSEEALLQVEFDASGDVIAGPDLPELVSTTLAGVPYCRALFLHLLYRDFLVS